jgi:hypothetical protein
MRPTFGTADKLNVITDYGNIPWDVENDRVLDYTGEAGRLYQQALDDNSMTYPDPYVEPPPAPEPPPDPQNVVLLDHENRLRTMEGQPPLTMDAFMTKHGYFRG